VSKKIKLTDANEKEQDAIPTYLLTTNKSFEHMIQKLMNTTSSLSINDLRQVAIAKHHIATLHIDKQISTIYLQSGTGQLKEPEAAQVGQNVQ
jgi:hypothetical protein